MRSLCVFLLFPFCALAQLNECTKKDGSIMYTDGECPAESAVVVLDIPMPPSSEEKAARAADDKELQRTCADKGYKLISSNIECAADQRSARARLVTLEQDKRDGWAVTKCLKQWRMPGRDAIDYTQAEHCVRIEVAANNR